MAQNGQVLVLPLASDLNKLASPSWGSGICVEHISGLYRSCES